MRIRHLRSETRRNSHRIAATVEWEHANQPALEMYFETPAKHASYLTLSPEPFLVASLVPALYGGERRIEVEGDVCPQLLAGLDANLGWFQYWHGLKPLRIEVGISSHAPRSGRTTASFLSGGVDSLYTLRANHLRVPQGHPMSIRDCIIVNGFDISWQAGKRPEAALFQRAVDDLAPLVEAAQVRLIPIHTNLRHLNDDVDFWMSRFFGAALSAVAHACASQVRTAMIASASDCTARTGPWGSTGFTDQNYSSSATQILHDGLWVTRLEKLGVVADWPVALKGLRVCTANRPEAMNCSACEKCLRTMTALAALGRLEQADTFPVKKVTKEMLGRVRIREVACEYYAELIGPLRAQGRHDLAEGVEQLLARTRKLQARQDGKDWRGRIKRIDHDHFGGLILSGKRKLALKLP